MKQLDLRYAQLRARALPSALAGNVDKPVAQLDVEPPCASEDVPSRERRGAIAAAVGPAMRQA